MSEVVKRDFEQEMAECLGEIVRAVNEWHKAASHEKASREHELKDSWVKFLNVAVDRGVSEFMAGKANSAS